MNNKLITLLAVAALTCTMTRCAFSAAPEAVHQEAAEAAGAVKFYPEGDEAGYILLNAKAAESIRASVKQVRKRPEVVVPTVVPTLGRVAVDGVEYRWLATNVLVSERMVKQGLEAPLPRTLMLSEAMSQAEWVGLWKHALEIHAPDAARDSRGMRELMEQTFRRLHAVAAPAAPTPGNHGATSPEL